MLLCEAYKLGLHEQDVLEEQRFNNLILEVLL